MSLKISLCKGRGTIHQEECELQISGMHNAFLHYFKLKFSIMLQSL